MEKWHWFAAICIGIGIFIDIAFNTKGGKHK